MVKPSAVMKNALRNQWFRRVVCVWEFVRADLIEKGIKSVSAAGSAILKPLGLWKFDSCGTISAYSHSLKFINSDLWRDLRIRIFKENRRHNLCFPQSVPFFSIKIVSRRYSKIIVDFSSEFKVVLCLFWNSFNPVANL